jgi:glycosyltransferase involved in cell wall biosynthesis
MLVPPSDRDALAHALIDVLGDTVRRRGMGEAARARFEARHRFEHFRDRLEAIVRAAFPITAT